MAGITESSIFINALSSEAAKWHEKRLKKIRAAGTKTGLNKVHNNTCRSKCNCRNRLCTCTWINAISLFMHVHVQYMYAQLYMYNGHVYVSISVRNFSLLAVFQALSGDTVEGKTKDTGSSGDVNESMESCVDDQMETDSTEPSKSKKRVTWASDDTLVNVQYFEVDEEERG